jgi:hypothetical protein
LITQPISDKESHAQEPRQEFNHRVVDGNMCMAVSAFSAKQQIAEHGDIVVKFDAMLTIGTA